MFTLDKKTCELTYNGLIVKTKYTYMMNPSLGGTTKNYFKEWLRNKKQPNHFPGSFTLNVFTIIISFPPCLSITCTNIWLEV
jgi:hypothetical protein